MGWVFEKIVEVVMQCISFLMSFLALQLVNVYKLDGRNTLNYFFAVFNGNSSVHLPDEATGTISAGVFYSMYKMCMYAGLGLIFLGMLYNLYKAFFGNLSHADPPGKTVFKSILFAGLCGFAQNIVAVVFDITQIPFNAVTKNLTAGTIASSIATNFGKLAANTFDNVTGWTVAGVGDVAGAAISGMGLGAAVFDVNFYVAIICIVLFIMMFKNFMMLALEMAERYLMIGVLAVFSPICIACGAVRATQDVFANWLSYMINACIVLTINTFFLAVFICNFVAYASIPYLLLWIAWIKTGQKIDEHMSGLGLKTAKTGGFGMDVMNAMKSSLPMALGAADKFAGTRLQGLHNAATRGGSAGKGWGLWQNDPRLGEKFKGAGNISDKKMAGLQKQAATVSGALNKAKEKMGDSTGHGSRTGISHEQLEQMAKNGTLPKPGQPGFENAAKDLMDAKLGKDENGKSLTQALDDKGYKITSMESDKDGNLKFSAEDQNGNVLVGEATNGPAGENSGNINMKGDNGQEMGLSLAQEQKEGQENPLEIGGIGGDIPDDADTAALPNANMEQDGTVPTANEDDSQAPDKTATGENAEDFGNVEAADGAEGGENLEGQKTAEVDGNTYTLGEPDDNGIITGTDADGNQMQFQKGEDGSLEAIGAPVEAESNPDKISTENGDMNVTGRDGDMVTATDEDGNEHTFKDNGDGTFSEVQQQASFTDADGNTWTDTGKKDADGNAIFADADGNEQSVSIGADGSVNEAGAKLDDGSGAQNSFTDTNGTTWTDTGKQDADGNAIFADADGNEKAVSVGADGSVSENGNRIDNGAGVQSSFTDADGTTWTAATTTDADGNTVPKTDANGNQVFTDGNGNEKSATVGADGSVNEAGNRLDNGQGVNTSNVETGATATNSFDGATVNDNGQNVQLSSNGDGTYSATSKDANGNEVTSTFASDGHGGLNKVGESTTSSLGADDNVNTANLSANIGGKDYSLSANADGKTYTANASDGSGSVQLSKNADGSWQATSQKGIEAGGSVSMGTAVQDSNGKTFNLSGSGDNVTGKAADGSTATFKSNGDGTYTKTSESRSFDTSKGISNESTNISSDNVKLNGSGGLKSVSVGGKEYSNFKDLGNGQMVGKAADGSTARFTNDNGNVAMQQSFAHDMNGQKFQVADSAITTSAKVNSDGSVTTTMADGSTKTMSQAAAQSQGIQTTFQNDKGDNVTLGSGGFNANFNEKTGQWSVTAKGFDGTTVGSGNASAAVESKHNVANATINAGGYSFSGDTKFTKSSRDENGQLHFTATDKSGTERTLSMDDLRNATATAGTTQVNPSYSSGSTVAVTNDKGRTTQVGTSNFNPNSAQSGVIVKGAGDDKSYFRTVGTQRYDAGGVPNPNGNYMMTQGADGQTHFKKVETNANGTVPTYKMNSEAAKINFQEKGSYSSAANLMNQPESNFAKHVDNLYGMPAQNQPATHLRTNDNQMYNIPKEDQMAGNTQKYVQIGNDYKALDMNRCKFTSDGQLERGSDVYLRGQEDTSKPAFKNDASSPMFHQNGKDDPALYYRGVNTRTNNEQFLNVDRNSTTPCVNLGTYHNGNNVNLDFSNASFSPVCEKGQPDGRQKVTWPGGQSAMLHPANTNTSGMNGSYVQVGGKEYFMSPNPNNMINSVAANIGKDWSFDRDIAPQKVTDTNALQTLRQNFGIPADASNVRIQHRKGDVGTIITYNHVENGQKKTFAITGNELRNSTNAEPIKGPNGTVMGVRQECKSDKVLVASKIKNFSNGMNFYYNSPGNRNKSKKRR